MAITTQHVICRRYHDHTPSSQYYQDHNTRAYNQLRRKKAFNSNEKAYLFFCIVASEHVILITSSKVVLQAEMIHLYLAEMLLG